MICKKYSSNPQNKSLNPRSNRFQYRGFSNNGRFNNRYSERRNYNNYLTKYNKGNGNDRRYIGNTNKSKGTQTPKNGPKKK
jgi:hypothetical protein